MQRQPLREPRCSEGGRWVFLEEAARENPCCRVGAFPHSSPCTSLSIGTLRACAGIWSRGCSEDRGTALETGGTGESPP